MTQVVLGVGHNNPDVWWRSYYSRVAPILSEEAVESIQRSRDTVEQLIRSGKVVYGINTGFGKLANQSVSPQDLSQLQTNLILAHSVGAGEPLPINVVRLAMLLKINSFAKGYSGVRLELVDRLRLFLAHEAYPSIPEKGSVGASGDLVPLAHMTLPLIGVGEVIYQGQKVSAELLHNRLRITSLSLEAKEGLAMLNGTQISTALAFAGLCEAQRALDTAIVVGALSTEAFLGLSEAFDPRIHALRGHSGQLEVARALRELISESGFREHSFTMQRRQDPYSIRCQPQILGPCHDTLAHANRVLAIEADAVTDNPLVFAETSEILSGGNFHAEEVAFVADAVAVAICEMGSLSERRLALLTDHSQSALPPFLTSSPGLNSGFMSAQIAAAAMVAENRQRSHPATVDNVPTVANVEDIVSMATHGARRLLPMVDTLDAILASELLAAVEGCDHRGFSLNSELNAVYEQVRQIIPRMDTDRYFAPAHLEARRLVKEGYIAKARPHI